MENKKEQQVILIIDDEESICRALATIFKDEGFDTLSVQSGEGGLKVIQEQKVDLVFLDIWMPQMDGLEVLQKIKEIKPELPVVMISGHATISTAMEATRMGATDFIEKPLELDAVLKVISRVLGTDSDVESTTTEEKSCSGCNGSVAAEGILIKNVAFENPKWIGKKLIQKTLKKSAILYGHGVHSGKRSGLVLEPLGPNSGIHFVAVTSHQAIPAHLNYVHSTGYATTIREGEHSVSTIEHLMSALHVYGISNLLIKCNGEVPVLDGSAVEFCNLIEQVGVEEQEGDFYAISLQKELRIGNDREFMLLEPADSFSVDYTLQYPDPIGKQHLVFNLDNPTSYKDLIAPARTFGFVKDIGALQKMGLAQGGRFDNFVLVGEDKIINADLRFEDEAVRHKILDMLGDLYMLGRPIHAKITACMTGHSDNIEMLKLLQSEMEK